MRICSVEGCDAEHRGLGYCRKHYRQIKTYGKILERTQQDKNETTTNGDIIIIDLYNINCIKIAETFCDLKYKTEIVKYKWHLSAGGYVITNWPDNGGQQHGWLHQLIIQLSGKIIKSGYEIDHKDGNKLNNLENNLRISTKTQNNQNSRIRKDNISGYKGVIWYNKLNKWRAYITINKKQIHLGYFNTKEDAARAYNIAAIKYFGEFAQLNDIKENI